MEIILAAKADEHNNVRWYAAAVDNNLSIEYSTEDKLAGTPQEALMILALDLFEDVKEQTARLDGIMHMMDVPE